MSSQYLDKPPPMTAAAELRDQVRCPGVNQEIISEGKPGGDRQPDSGVVHLFGTDGSRQYDLSLRYVATMGSRKPSRDGSGSHSKRPARVAACSGRLVPSRHPAWFNLTGRDDGRPAGQAKGGGTASPIAAESCFRPPPWMWRGASQIDQQPSVALQSTDSLIKPARVGTLNSFKQSRSNGLTRQVGRKERGCRTSSGSICSLFITRITQECLERGDAVQACIKKCLML